MTVFRSIVSELHLHLLRTIAAAHLMATRTAAWHVQHAIPLHCLFLCIIACTHTVLVAYHSYWHILGTPPVFFGRSLPLPSPSTFRTQACPRFDSGRELIDTADMDELQRTRDAVNAVRLPSQLELPALRRLETGIKARGPSQRPPAQVAPSISYA